MADLNVVVGLSVGFNTLLFPDDPDEAPEPVMVLVYKLAEDEADADTHSLVLPLDLAANIGQAYMLYRLQEAGTTAQAEADAEAAERATDNQEESA